MEGYVASLVEAQGDSAALTNTTTPTSLLLGQSKFTYGAGFFNRIGKGLHIKAAGRMSTVVTTPGTLTLDIRFGSVVVSASSAMVLSTTAKTNVSWMLDLLLTCRSIGSGTAATMIGQGVFTSEACGATTVAGEAKSIGWPTSAPAVGTGFDSTAAFVLDMFGTWSVASASNSILTHQFYAFSPN